MTTSLARTFVDSYCRTHERLLTFVEKMSDAQLQWRAAPEALSIAFHLWHTAR